MELENIISISNNILENILLNQIKKIPGIDVNANVKINIDSKNSNIDIYVFPINLLSSIYSISVELQKSISWYIHKQFDIPEGLIKINIIVDSN